MALLWKLRTPISAETSCDTDVEIIAAPAFHTCHRCSQDSPAFLSAVSSVHDLMLGTESDTAGAGDDDDDDDDNEYPEVSCSAFYVSGGDDGAVVFVLVL